jgi:hypothetical protein
MPPLEDAEGEPLRAAAAVAAAYASLAPETAPTPPPAPAPEKCGCGGKCVDGRYKPDGQIIMQCEKDCHCGCRKSLAPRR